MLNCGTGKCVVEQIQNEDKVAAGEWFFTSGEDRIFPKGFPAGTVISAEPGQGMKDVKLRLTGAPAGTEEVLVVLRGVHQPIPAEPPADETMAQMLEPPPPDSGSDANRTTRSQTEADKILQKYEALGKEEGHVYGAVGSSIPDFNLKRSTQPKQPPQARPARTVMAPQQNKPEQKEQEKPESQAAAVTPVPAILGSRSSPKPPAPKPMNAKAEPGMSPEPVLPLGAPRRRPPAPKTTPEERPSPTREPPPQP